MEVYPTYRTSEEQYRRGKDMRCRCCDCDETVLWKENYYCKPCLTAIRELLREDVDNKEPDLEAGESWITHGGWDDGV